MSGPVVTAADREMAEKLDTAFCPHQRGAMYQSECRDCIATALAAVRAEGLAGGITAATWKAMHDGSERDVAELQARVTALEQALQATMEFCILQEHADIVKQALAPGAGGTA